MFVIKILDIKSLYLRHINRKNKCQKFDLEETIDVDILYKKRNNINNKLRIYDTKSNNTICAYCNNEYTNKYVLKKHLTTCETKKTLELEKKNISNQMKLVKKITKNTQQENNIKEDSDTKEIIKHNKIPKKKFKTIIKQKNNIDTDPDIYNTNNIMSI